MRHLLQLKTLQLFGAVVVALSVLAHGNAAAQSENVEFRTGTFDLVLPPFVLDGSVTKGEQTVDFSVGNVSIQRIRFQRTDIGDLRRIDMVISLYNRKGHDKRVSLTLDLRNGDEVIARPFMASRRVEETDHRKTEAALVASRKQMSSTTTLHLVLATSDE